MDKKRNFNILFHLHTVSGIIISAVLFIMFFCGALSMIREEIKVWEDGIYYQANTKKIDYDRIRTEVDKQYKLTGRNLSYYLDTSLNTVNVYIDQSNKPDASEKDLETYFLEFNLDDYSFEDRDADYKYGNFIYQLHYLGQIPQIGVYLAGIVSLIFMFALFTGVYIHWDKILKNIVLFRPYAKWKTIWTDAHTVLGTIGLPFQLMYALTGAYFCLNILLLLPAYSLYNNDEDKLMAELAPQRAHAPWDTLASKDLQPKSINSFVEANFNKWEGFIPFRIDIENVGGTNMEYKISGSLSEDLKLSSDGFYTVNAYTLEKLDESSPYETTYPSDVQEVLSKLHFGYYGGYIIKFIYIGLAFLTCFVIISGVMVWLVARKKLRISEKKKKFNFQVANIYLAVCLSLFPMTGLGFIIVKLLPKTFSGDKEILIYSFFFIGWLLVSLYFILKKNLNYTNACSLFLGGIFYLFVPVVNGFVTNKWLWTTFNTNLKPMFIVDIFSFILGITALYSFYILLNRKTIS